MRKQLFSILFFSLIIISILFPETIILKDDSKIIGNIVSENDKMLTVNTSYGKIEIKKTDVSDIQSNNQNLVINQIMPKFELITNDAPFGKLACPLCVVFKNKIWIIGGSLGQGIGGSNDIWCSDDGKNWYEIKNNLKVSVSSWNYDIVKFKDKIWIIGEKGVLNSSDGMNWNYISKNPEYGKRYLHSCVIFNNKLWIIAGNMGFKRLKDVWYSEDGIKWIQSASNIGTSLLMHKAVVFNKKILLIGGCYDTGDLFQFNNKIWFSEDGKNWKNSDINLPGNNFHSCIIYDNKIYVIGGEKEGGGYSTQGDIWYSNDTTNWNVISYSSIPSRSRFGCFIFKDKILIIGGNFTSPPSVIKGASISYLYKDIYCSIPTESALDDIEKIINENKLDEAKQICSFYISNKAFNSRSYYYLGVCYQKEGNLKKAEDCFKFVLKYDEQNEKAIIQLAKILINKNQHDNAMVLLSYL